MWLHCGEGQSSARNRLCWAQGVVEMVGAANDVGDPHVAIVDDHRQHVGRCAVGAQKHHVVELFVGDRDPALDEIVDRGLPLERSLEADDGIDAGGRFARIAVAPAPVVDPAPAFGPGARPHRRQLLRRGEAEIRLAPGEQLVGDLGMARRARELEHRLAVPVDAQPVQAGDDRRHRRRRRASAVRILDAQPKGAARMPRIEPVEQRGARAADMERPGRGGGEACDDRHDAARRRTALESPRLYARRRPLSNDRVAEDFPRPVGGWRRAPGLAELSARLAAERDRWRYWLPVALGVGVAAYFGMTVEPPPWLPLVLGLSGAAASRCLAAQRRGPVGRDRDDAGRRWLRDRAMAHRPGGGAAVGQAAVRPHGRGPRGRGLGAAARPETAAGRSFHRRSRRGGDAEICARHHPAPRRRAGRRPRATPRDTAPALAAGPCPDRTISNEEPISSASAPTVSAWERRGW